MVTDKSFFLSVFTHCYPYRLPFECILPVCLLLSFTLSSPFSRVKMGKKSKRIRQKDSPKDNGKDPPSLPMSQELGFVGMGKLKGSERILFCQSVGRYLERMIVENNSYLEDFDDADEWTLCVLQLCSFMLLFHPCHRSFYAPATPRTMSACNSFAKWRSAS